VAVGPAGELYTVWHSIGRQDNSPYGRDFLRVRRSTDQGASFNPEATAESLFSNFPSGGPGFNRPIGITFPGIAVDRSNGPHRGRVYLTWNESLNFYADADRLPNPQLGDPGINETENNNAASVADGFTPGLILRGGVAPTSDLDYWSWQATQGITYFFWLDSMGVNLDASFRVFCSDGVTNLAFNQNAVGDGFGGELLVFTAPTSATYYLRVASYEQARTGAYRIRTTTHLPRGDDRARDHRDIFVKSSPNGFTWGPTVRVNDDPGYLDDFLPEVAVDGEGRVWIAHYDYRDSPAVCGGGSNIYLARSDDGGQGWLPETRISDVTTNWTLVHTNLIPNYGDYIGLFAQGDRVALGWGDGRNGDPDVYFAGFSFCDIAAPSFTLSLDPDLLWPPNRQWVAIHATAVATDPCDGAPEIRLVSITSDEGDASEDVQGAELGTTDFDFELRAERSGDGDGRDYVVCYQALDASGNGPVVCDTVRVPHDRPERAGLSFVTGGAWLTVFVDPPLSLGSIDAGSIQLGTSRYHAPIRAETPAHSGMGENGVAQVVYWVENDVLVPWDREEPLFARWEAQGQGYLAEVTTDSREVDVGETRHEFAIAALPNPAQDRVVISYALPEAGITRLSVFDVAGHLVARLVDGRQEPGRHEIRFDAPNRRSQLYFYRFEWNGRVLRGKFAFMR